ncbi:hypothetical protein [Bifidobacterium saguini]|nr:hypothetical protein [Bifidobacterium saguini]
MMALTYITYKCGHEDRIQIYGTNVHGERDRKAAWYNTIDCPECRKANAARWCAEHGCAPLEGSPKQVAWAETIRFEAIAGLETLYEEMQANNPPETVSENARSVIRQAKGETRAVWWIDNRDTPSVREAASHYRDNRR